MLVIFCILRLMHRSVQQLVAASICPACASRRISTGSLFPAWWTDELIHFLSDRLLSPAPSRKGAFGYRQCWVLSNLVLFVLLVHMHVGERVVCHLPECHTPVCVCARVYTCMKQVVCDTSVALRRELTEMRSAHDAWCPATHHEDNIILLSGIPKA